MNNITIVLPVYEYTDDLKKLYTRAIGSIPCDEDGKALYPVILVGPKDIMEKYKIDAFNNVINFKYVENNETDFQTQINVAAKACDTDYFSVLEIDDMYNPNWFRNVEKHIETMPETPFFLPLTEVFDASSGELVPVGFANEIALTTSFSDAIGYIGIDELNEFSDFSCTGGVYRVADFLEIGGLKKNLKIVFWYEFLMRAANNHKEAYVIPKLGYKHSVRRPGSLMDMIPKTIDSDEAKFWYETAKQEYFFNEDRKREYKK